MAHENQIFLHSFIWLLLVTETKVTLIEYKLYTK